MNSVNNRSIASYIRYIPSYAKYIPTVMWDALDKVRTQIVFNKTQSNGEGEPYLLIHSKVP